MPAMPAVAPPRVKVCCIADLAEARLAIAHGAAALGLVSSMPSGPGVIDETVIAAVAAAVATEAPAVETFLLTCLTEAEAIVAQHRRCGTTTLQLVDALAPGELPRLRAALPAVRLVQVVHVTGVASLDEALAAAPHVDAVLLDSGAPQAVVKQLGGTGRTHDWATSRRIRDALAAHGVPLYLAGGLRPDNVAAAIAQVAPFGLDLCTGVRRHGRLDADRLAGFFAALGAADAGAAPATS